nr:hypothetical protein [Candidatus Baldrarchaeota archaeon]
MSARESRKLDREGEKVVEERLKKRSLHSIFFSSFNKDGCNSKKEEEIDLGELIKLSLQRKLVNMEFDILNVFDVSKQKKLIEDAIADLKKDLEHLKRICHEVSDRKSSVEFLKWFVSKNSCEDLSSVEKSLVEKVQLLEIIDFLCKKMVHLILLLKEILSHYLEVLSKGDKSEKVVELLKSRKFIGMLLYALRLSVPFALQGVPPQNLFQLIPK